MRKYLITGAMALLAGFYLTSCTHDDIEYSSVYEEKTQTFEKVFHDLYGNIDPNHDWGFKSLNSIAIANSRAVAGTRAAGTRGENANANEWADVSNSTGFGGWKVPPALTDQQKLRVRAYFQAKPNLQYKDPHLKNFFVQQVYKGGDAPNRNTSSEVVIAAGGQEYTSTNMNHLTVGQSNVHINNFNCGDATERTDVLNNGANLKTGENVGYHSDKIMLMMDINDTSCFGYHDSGSSNEDKSVNHNDRCALVSASDIDAWGDANHIGEKVFSKEWNRSFLGFDLAIKEGDQIWSGETQKFTSGMNMGYDGLYYSNNNTVAFEYDENWNRLMPNGMSDVMTDKDDNPLKLLISNTNFYSGDLETLSDEQLRKDMGEGKVYVNMEPVLDLINRGFYPVSGSAFKTWVKPEKSYDGYFSDWIVTLTQATEVGNTEKIDGPDDQHHGDEVKKTSTGDEHKLLAIGRVFVEDLFKASREDLDFNDAVFDAAIWQTTTNGTITVAEDGTKTFTPSENENSVVTREAEIYLIAAGGTIPLMIANGCPEIGDGSDQKHEVHEIFDVSGVTMVNTRGQYSEAFGSYKNGISPKYKKFNMTAALKDKPEGEITLNDIPVDVIWTTDQFSVPASLNNETIVEYQKDPETGKYILENGEPVRVNTGVAKAPHIICVPLGTDWATERRNIADCYPAFGDYVGRSNTEYECWNSATQESRFNIYEQNVTTFNKANYGDGETALTPRYAYYTNVQVISNEKEITLWEDNLDFGWSNKLSLAADAFTKNNAKSGDKIRFYLTSSATKYQSNENGWDFNIFTGWEQGYKNGSILHVYGNSADISKGYYEFTPTAEDIAALRMEVDLGGKPSSSLQIQGQKFVLTKITLVQQK